MNITGIIFCFYAMLYFQQSNSMDLQNLSISTKLKNATFKQVEGNIIIHFDDERLQKSASINAIKRGELLPALKDIRARIVLDKNKRNQIFSLLNVKNIREEIKNIIKNERSYLSKFTSNYNTLFSDDDLEKMALLSSVFLPWNNAINILKLLSPENNVIHKYSFEDSIFVLFMCPKYPSLFYKLLNTDKYKAEEKFYVSCLASAIKNVIEKIDCVKIPVAGREVKGRSIAENVYYGYWNNE